MATKEDYLPTTKFIGFDPRTSVYQLHNFVNKQCENLMLERVLVYYNGNEAYALVTTTNEQLIAKICIHFNVTSIPVGRVNVQSMLWNSQYQYDTGKKAIQKFADEYPGEAMIMIVMYHLADCTMATDCVTLLDEFCQYYPFDSTDNLHVIVKPDFVPHVVQCIKGGQIIFKKDPPSFRVHPNLQTKSPTFNRLKLKVEAMPDMANDLVDWLFKRKYMPSIKIMRKSEMLYPWDPKPGEPVIRNKTPRKKPSKSKNPMWDRTNANFTPVYSATEDGSIIRHGKANWTWDWKADEVENDGKEKGTKLTWSTSPQVFSEAPK